MYGAASGEGDEEGAGGVGGGGGEAQAGVIWGVNNPYAEDPQREVGVPVEVVMCLHIWEDFALEVAQEGRGVEARDGVDLVCIRLPFGFLIAGRRQRDDLQRAPALRRRVVI